MANNRKFELVGFESAVFSKDQLDFVAAQAHELQVWVESYRISPEAVEIDEAQENEDAKPGTVFTLAFAPAHHDGFTVRYGLVPGLWPDEDEYYISEVKIDESAEDYAYAYTIIDFYCTVCKGPGSDNKDCLNCIDGELSVDLYWDENWKVTAEYSDPRA